MKQCGERRVALAKLAAISYNSTGEPSGLLHSLLSHRLQPSESIAVSPTKLPLSADGSFPLTTPSVK